MVGNTEGGNSRLIIELPGKKDRYALFSDLRR